MPKAAPARKRPVTPLAESFTHRLHTLQKLTDKVTQDAYLAATGLPLERERLLSSPFIVSPNYGTRSSSVLALREDGAGQLDERRFAPDGSVSGESRLTFSWQPADTIA